MRFQQVLRKIDRLAFLPRRRNLQNVAKGVAKTSNDPPLPGNR
jgi:hypothetical protein